MKKIVTLIIKPFKGKITPKSFLYRGEACLLEAGIERFFLIKKTKDRSEKKK